MRRRERLVHGAGTSFIKTSVAPTKPTSEPSEPSAYGVPCTDSSPTKLGAASLLLIHSCTHVAAPTLLHLKYPLSEQHRLTGPMITIVFVA